ncbi:alpha-1,4-glucan:maltose-1-phosphate maltosyltransferase [Ilumatobacter fluminis]|uniref:Alpha-1,4-glucan:maltose-1-phosphate maltosyltransferase n=1 Tax=Ilumatobacter fluminis TaxID=467091 RepID=A0A4R7HX24_9ACTN|nr:alpha-1,4-glucan--maltose-1-phosphate maltosyltransferase [Ilumatobacter fluminis]TDT14736.1 alpha-1,4-glucan:maltose-1-phosphate maltosyltransferase [Ilumatobacter fluminis]
MSKMPKRRPARAVIEPVSPVVDGGRFPSKAALGEPVVVTADVFGEGHDAIDAAIRWRHAPVVGDAGPWVQVPMQFVVNDRWTASFVPTELGRHQYEIIAWSDHVESWRHGTERKAEAGVDIGVELLDGERITDQLLATAKKAKPRIDDDVETLERLLAAIRDGDAEVLHDEAWPRLSHRYIDRKPAAASAKFDIDVDPERARFSAWYEFFPRSPWSGDAPNDEHATLRDAIDRLDRVEAMGFDVLYLPPIHPIGEVNRKGRNNTTEASPDDVGSPWGISDHYAVHPELGTVDDVTALATAARERGIELALDIAFQCTPDHVWVDEHPDWFKHRADGTIQYAENPPKKYQDIYPIDFETDDWEALWTELANVIRFWVDRGVTIFRVDNPHTKAFPFWEWALGSIRADHPETIFLAEAFTRPRVMERLAKIGFNQSYTYFTWRRSAWELREYFTDLSTRTVDYYRPNAWPNTPDILTDQLQHGGRPVFAVRAVLAATLSANWGIYGPAFEVVEQRAIRPGSEEYLDSEKYQTRQWDLDTPDSLEPLITKLNRIRADQPALRHLSTLRFHDVDSDGLLCFTKTDPLGEGDPILVIVNLNGYEPHSGHVHVDPSTFGLGIGDDDEFVLEDLLGGGIYRWRGWHNYVELSPGRTGYAHVFAVRPADR